MKPVTEQRISFLNQHLILTAQKALFWEEQNALILSDLHLGKAGHFRKAGIAIPKSVDDQNLYRLDVLIERFNPKRILFLGDLFHSNKNKEWESFIKWRSKYSNIDMHLALGNHDFHSPDEYESIGLICSNKIESDPFLLLHEDTSKTDSETLYPISGHIHPSIRMVGKGRQAKRIPCFYFGKTSALLPAFGNFTGTHNIKPSVNDSVFGVVENQIIQIS